MGCIRSLFAALAGAVIAFLLGMAFDYFRLAMGYDTEGLLMVFPTVAGVAGFVAAVIALIMARGGAATREPGRPSASARPVRGRTAEDVPGMPTFDFDKERQSARQAGPDKPKEQQ